MIPNDIAIALLVIIAILAFTAYWCDLKEARYFAAMRKAAHHPFADRLWHEKFARKHNLFWKPCPVCDKPFGGHEMLGKTIPHTDPDKAIRGHRLPICPECAVPLRNPGTSSKDFNGSLHKRAQDRPDHSSQPKKD